MEQFLRVLALLFSATCALSSAPACAGVVVFAFNGYVTSGPGAPGQIAGQFSYDSSRVSDTLLQLGGTGNAVFGNFDYARYEFSGGGLAVVFTGALNGRIDATVGGTNFVELVDGSDRDAFRFAVVGDDGQRFVYNIVTPEVNFISTVSLPSSLSVPTSIDSSLGESLLEVASSSCSDVTCYSVFIPSRMVPEPTPLALIITILACQVGGRRWQRTRRCGQV